MPQPAVAGIGPQLLERMVRVEEELKSQRELMEIKFDAVDRRFEAMDKRFEDLIANMDKRFESVDKRFNTLTWMIGVGFVVITSLTTLFALVA